MRSHPSPGAPSPGAPAPSASRIQTRSSPNIAAAGPSVGAPGPSSSAGHISPKSNQKKHKMPISMKMNDGSVVDKVLEFEEEHYHKIWFYGKPALISGGLVAINLVKKFLTPTQKSKFRSTSFGHFLDFEPLVFSGQLVHCMLLKEVFHLNPNEMMFKVHETLLKFSISDFALITGLNCAEYLSFCNEDGIPKQLPFGSSWLCSKYFPGKSSIYRGDLYDFLDQNQVKDDTDAIKLVLIFIVDYILLSKKDNKLVDKYLWHMVDSLDMFGSFPWGRKSFLLTLEYLKKALKGKQTDSQQDVIHYELFGFPTAFQIWIYECFISLPKTVISYNGPKIPRICSWSKAFKSKFFSLNEKFFDCEEVC
ncbi:hypothetical protein UlMin_002864 [Ulmus minor]